MAKARQVEPLVGVGTAAVLAGVSPKTWSRLAWRDVPLLRSLHFTEGGHRRWPLSAIEDYKARRKGGAK